MKKILLLCLTFILTISMSISTYADTTLSNYTNDVEVIEYEESVLNSISNTPTPDGISATQLESDLNTETNRASFNSITPFFIRQSDNSTVVQVYLKFSGTNVANAIKFSEMTIQSTSFIFQQTYGSLTPKVYPFNYPSTFCNLYIGSVNIPTSVDKVRVQDSGLKAYYIDVDEPGWNSFSNIIGEWPIQ